MMNAVITNFVNTLSKLKSEEELCQAIAHQVSNLTGFDRILLYRFDEAGHGIVLSETNNGNLPSYLGLRFPASDIPSQARALYVLNTVRIIPDAHYTPVPLHGVEGQQARTLDLSLSVLRSVSPVHIEYMRNMGTISSMSISIIFEGQLWGLISGHHATPHTVPYLIRSACDMLTRMVGTQLVSYRTEARLNKMLSFHSVQRQMLTRMAAEPDYLGSLSMQMQDLMRVTDADGVALWLDGSITRAGLTPDDASLAALAAWMKARPEQDIFTSSHFALDHTWAAGMRSVASGLLAISISAVRGHYIFWFRPELVQTVVWAGEPKKELDAAHRLNPRSSFESWKEIVSGQSQAWTAMDMESAAEFRSALISIGLRQAEEDVELSEARFRQLTNALPTKIFTADDEGNITYVNEGWRSAGLNLSGLWFSNPNIHPEDAARCATVWALCTQTGEDFEEEVRLKESVPSTKDGSITERWNFIHAVPFNRLGAQRAGWVGTCTDLTERGSARPPCASPRNLRSPAA